MKKTNITFIGMAGVGKSTIGALTAEKLGWTFVDIDILLEQERGKPLQSILEEIGEDGFLNLETQKVRDKAKFDKQVIAPGGSIVYAAEAMRILKDRSEVIYLDAKPEFIEKRIDITNRGIVGIKDKDFKTLFAERERLYKKYADHTVEVTNESPEQIVNEALSLLKL